jgi:hypothetical protein
VNLPRILLPLRHRDFRLLWSGQTLTLLGSFVSQVAYPFQILQLGGSALELGAIASIFTATSPVSCCSAAPSPIEFPVDC